MRNPVRNPLLTQRPESLDESSGAGGRGHRQLRVTADPDRIPLHRTHVCRQSLSAAPACGSPAPCSIPGPRGAAAVPWRGQRGCGRRAGAGLQRRARVVRGKIAARSRACARGIPAVAGAAAGRQRGPPGARRLLGAGNAHHKRAAAVVVLRPLLRRRGREFHQAHRAVSGEERHRLHPGLCRRVGPGGGGRRATGAAIARSGRGPVPGVRLQGRGALRRARRHLRGLHPRRARRVADRLRRHQDHGARKPPPAQADVRRPGRAPQALPALRRRRHGPRDAGAVPPGLRPHLRLGRRRRAVRRARRRQGRHGRLHRVVQQARPGGAPQPDLALPREGPPLAGRPGPRGALASRPHAGARGPAGLPGAAARRAAHDRRRAYLLPARHRQHHRRPRAQVQPRLPGRLWHVPDVPPRLARSPPDGHRARAKGRLLVRGQARPRGLRRPGAGIRGRERARGPHLAQHRRHPRQLRFRRRRGAQTDGGRGKGRGDDRQPQPALGGKGHRSGARSWHGAGERGVLWAAAGDGGQPDVPAGPCGVQGVQIRAVRQGQRGHALPDSPRAGELGRPRRRGQGAQDAAHRDPEEDLPGSVVMGLRPSWLCMGLHW